MHVVPRTDGVEASRVGRVGDHGFGQIHLRQLGGEQQIFGCHSGTILRSSTFRADGYQKPPWVRVQRGGLGGFDGESILAFAEGQDRRDP